MQFGTANSCAISILKEMIILQDEMNWKELYRMYLGEIRLPILPENFKEMIQIDNKKYDTFGKGERALPGKEKLHTWIVSSYFPCDGEIPPAEYKRAIEGLIRRDYGKNPEPIKPINFILARELEDGTIIFGIDSYALIESIEWEDRKGEPGDLYYTIKLIEYKDFKTK